MSDIIMNATEPTKPLPRRWSPEQRARLSQVMKEKHAAKAAAGKAWKPNGAHKPEQRHPLPEAIAVKIRELRKTDASVKSIAKQLGVSESSVYKFSTTKPYQRKALTSRQAAMAHARQFRHVKPNGLDHMTKEEAWMHVTLWHKEYLKARRAELEREIPGPDQVLKAMGLLP